MQPSRFPLRKLVAALTSFCVLVAPTGHAQNVGQDIESQMSDLYNGMVKMPGDIVGDITDGTMTSEPSAFHGQVWNTYSGGRVAKRLPVKSLTLVNMDMPRFSAGCGGIDMYLGSISHLDASEFVEFLKATAMNASGVITQVALSAITPLLGSTLAEAKNIVDRINGMMRNSCELAQTAVNGAVDQLGGAKNESCIQGQMMNGGLDRNEATQVCGSTQGQSGFGASLPPPFTGNMTWQMVKQAGLTGTEALLIMNLVGTVIYPPATAPQGTNPEKTVSVKPPLKLAPQLNLSQLIAGTADPAVDGNIQLQLWTCDNSDGDCLNPELKPVTVKAFTTMVKDNMKALRQAVLDRDEPSPDLMRFVNGTRMPVAKMAQVGSKESFAAEHLADSYGELIALDYASTMIRSLIDTFLAASKGQLKFSETKPYSFTKDQEAVRDMIVAFAKDRLQVVDMEQERASASLVDFNRLGDTLEKLERKLYSQQPHLASLYGHGSLLPGWR